MILLEKARWLGLFTILIAGCGGDTYCQSGPKFGTQCMSLSDARNPPGQRPPLSSEPPAWFQPRPPTGFGSSAKAAPPSYPPGPYPTAPSSLASSPDAGTH